MKFFGAKKGVVVEERWLLPSNKNDLPSPAELRRTAIQTFEDQDFLGYDEQGFF